MADEMLVLQVGEPHPSMGQRLPLEDGMVAGLLGGLPVLVIGLRRPVPREVAAVERGGLHIGLVPMYPHGYAWVVEVEGAGCWEATYTPLLGDDPERLSPSLPEAAEHLALQVHLVDGDSGQIEAMRVVGAPPRFSATLRTLHETAAANWDSFMPSRWTEACQQCTARHPQPRDAFRNAVAEFAVGPVL